MDQPEELKGISAPVPSPTSEASVNDWPMDQPEELEDLSQPIAIIVHRKAECVTLDNTSDPSGTKTIKMLENKQNKAEEIKDFVTNLFAKMQENSVKLQETNFKLQETIEFNKNFYEKID
jgi:hypothetical protein